MSETQPQHPNPPLVRIVESLLFGGRWLLAPLYLAMPVLPGLLLALTDRIAGHD